MTDDDLFAGAQAKLRRADKHLKLINRKWNAFQKTEPNGVGHQYWLETKSWDARFIVEKPIPIEFSTIMGDALGNLRACLDHLVGCFVVRYGGAIKSNHAFPIYGDERTFIAQVQKARRKGDRGGPLKGIPSDSPEWALIEAAQPYHRGDGARDHPLAVLNEMVNIDKHRRLHAAMTYFNVSSVLDLFEWEPPSAELIDLTPRWEPGLPLEDGTHMATLRFSAEHPASIVRVKNPVSVSIVFGDHEPERSRGNFGDIYGYVKQIVSDAKVLLL